MLPENNLLQLVPGRINMLLGRLKQQIWHPIAPVTDLHASEASPNHVTWAGVAKLALSPISQAELPQFWGKLWDQRWVKVTLPSNLPQDEELYLEWDDQGEATAYINGVPHYGLDIAHPYAPLPTGAREVWIESMTCRTGILACGGG